MTGRELHLIEESKAESVFCPLLKDGCKGSGCAMWRWDGAPRPIFYAEDPKYPPKENWVLIEEMPPTGTGTRLFHYEEPPKVGYCGLAGRGE